MITAKTFLCCQTVGEQSVSRKGKKAGKERAAPVTWNEPASAVANLLHKVLITAKDKCEEA